jgi:methylthioribulose-1-phosphate dehydratase
VTAVVDAARQLAAIGQRFYSRGWVLGTSGNFSAVLQREPLRLAITPSGAHKGTLTGDEFVVVDDSGAIADGLPGRPSAETRLHVEIARHRGAGAVLHTHSIWSTILSDRYATAGGLAIRGYEMLKGLTGVSTHEHREWVPILPNDQNMSRLANVAVETLEREPAVHAFLLRAHGLYTWGATIEDAERHVEILEFLFEAIGRSTDRPGAANA